MCLKKRVCVITGGHWAATIGGAQYQAKCLVDEMVKEDVFEIYYLARKIDKDYKSDGYKIIQIKKPGKISHRAFFFDAAHLLKLLNTIKPHIIYQRGLQAYTGIAAYFSERNDCKFIFHIALDNDVLPINRKQLNWHSLLKLVDQKIGQYGLKRANYVIAQTNQQSELLERNYNRIADAVIPNFHPCPEETIKKSSCPLKIVWIANFKSAKQPEMFVQLAEDLKDLNDVEFIMIGRSGGKQYKELHLRMSQLINLQYLGEQPIREVNKVLAKSHIFVNTSAVEGFPNTFIQAWMRKVPVVSMEVNTDGIFNDSSIGLYGGSYIGLKSAILKLINNSKLRETMGECAYNYALEKHSMRNVEKLISIIKLDSKNNHSYINKPAVRFAYCKHADVVQELQRLGPSPAHVPDGGPDHYIANFLNYVQGKPTLLLSHYNKNSYLKKENVKARVLKAKILISLGPLSTFFSIFYIFTSTITYLIKFHPTTILCATHGPSLWACFVVSRLYDARLVCTRHAALELRTSSVLEKIQYYLNKLVLNRASIIICHGPYLEKELLEMGIGKEHFFQFNLSYRYLIETNSNQTIFPELSNNGNKTIILYTGRIRRIKGVFDLLEAMSPILGSNSDFTLVFAGDGPDLNELKQNISTSPLKNQIVLLGHIDHDLLPSLIHQSHFIVTPSRSSFSESRCKAAIEAIVLGRPVVAPEFGPFPFVVKNNENGLLFTPDSITDLRDKLSAILENQKFYSKLKAGAEKSGQELLHSEFNFQQALEKAFTGIIK